MFQDPRVNPIKNSASLGQNGSVALQKAEGPCSNIYIFLTRRLFHFSTFLTNVDGFVKVQALYTK